MKVANSNNINVSLAIFIFYLYLRIFVFMNYFIHMLMWISSLGLHTENHKNGILGIYPKKVIVM